MVILCTDNMVVSLLNRNKVAILLLSLLLGTMITIQLKTVERSTGGLVSSQKARQLSTELKRLKDKKEALSNELSMLESRIREYEESEAKENIVVKNLKEDIKRYEVLAGYSKVKGPGVKIAIDVMGSEQESETIIYNYEMLLSVINKLNASGAEAISINGERIVVNTEIHLSANSRESIFINDKPVKTPFEIRAIGNPDTLEAALNMRYGIMWEIRQYLGLKTDVSKHQEIEIPRNTEKIQFEFSKPVE